MTPEEIKKEFAARIENIESRLENNRDILSRLCVDSIEYEIIYRLHREDKQAKKDLETRLALL
jgi:hypothetical protein